METNKQTEKIQKLGPYDTKKHNSSFIKNNVTKANIQELTENRGSQLGNKAMTGEQQRKGLNNNQHNRNVHHHGKCNAKGDTVVVTPM